MKIKKKNLEMLTTILLECKGISLKDGRVRDSVLKELKGFMVDFYRDQKIIVEKFCDKDEQEVPITTKVKGKIEYTFKPDVKIELNKEMDLFLAEEVEVFCPADLKKIAEATSYQPEPGETEEIDALLDLML